jgi:metal-responsive CopG/Arc/MetJ family transcriptional regulator
MARPKLYENDAARVAAYRARQNLVTLTVDLPAEVVAGLDEYLKFKGVTKRQVIEKLLRTQLLRKR